MRTFISIDMPEIVKREIKKIQNNLPEFYGKKTESENLHLTLKFLGEIDEKTVEKVKEKLKEMKFKKFEVEIDSVGFFSEKFIRIIWLHIKNCEALQEQIDEKLSEMFEKEKRFMSHLTIARVKNVKDRKIFIEKIKKIEIPKIKFLVNNFELKESTLTENGPIYKNIRIYDLK